jgi:GT2 family glycosyltransferase/glycosyltransferase involved in cell wall biosynthesis
MSMASRPYSSAVPAEATGVVDAKERRRSAKRGSENRVSDLEKTVPAEIDADGANEDGETVLTTAVLVETLELDMPSDDQTFSEDALTETALSKEAPNEEVLTEAALTNLASGETPAIDAVVPDEVVVEAVLADTPEEPASARDVLPMGNVDSLDGYRIEGWVWFPHTPDESIDVRILVDDVSVLNVRADRFREGLKKAGAGNGRHGFLVRNFEAHVPPGTHSVRVLRASDGLELPGSPRSITRLEPADANDEGGATDAADGSKRYGQRPTTIRLANVSDPHEPMPIGNIDRIDYDEISGWAWDPERPNESIDIEILDDGEVVLQIPADQFRADLVDAGTGSGRHGFSVTNLGGVFPLSRHRLRVRRARDGQDLPDSPSWISRPALDYRTVDFIEKVMLAAVQAASNAEDLAAPLAFLLSQLNELVNAYEGLVQTQKNAMAIPLTELADGQLTGKARELVDHMQYAYAPLYFEPSDRPEVSVIIPVYGKFAYTYNCLKSIRDALPKRSFEIIIVDDCSDDETMFAALVFAGAVRIVRNVKNLGFVRTCNAGAAAAKGKYLLFLNNDTLVREGWLDELVETFEEVPNVGIAGSKLLFEDGKLQEAGGIIWRLGDGWNWGRGRDPDEPAFSYLRDADWVSGAALMIEASMFGELGGFDDIFAPGYYEDTDLAFRVRARGKRVVMQPASVIVHLEGVSSGTDTSGPGMKRYQVINHAKFYQRWKATLMAHRYNGQFPEREAERLVQRRAYFIDDTVPTPDQDAGSNAAIEHMRALMELGYKVTFLPADNMCRIDPYTANLLKLGIECLYHPHFWSVEEVFRKAENKPDLVYLHRYTNASKYATMVRRYFPDCRVVYNVADLHFLRMERQAKIDPGSVSATHAAAQRRSELSAMQNVDSVIVHSPVEARLLHEAEPSLNVEVVPWTVRRRPSSLPFADRSGGAFVGGFGHPPNVDAVDYLVSDIVPPLRQQSPYFRTYLIGSKMPDDKPDWQVPGVVPLGFVPVLADVLHKLRCTVVPLRYGAGIKGKVLESFAHGLPCVMSEVAAEGLELPVDLAWLVARTPTEFAEKLARVHEDEAFNQKLSEAGLAYIERRHKASVVKEALRAAVAG